MVAVRDCKGQADEVAEQVEWRMSVPRRGLVWGGCSAAMAFFRAVVDYRSPAQLQQRPALCDVAESADMLLLLAHALLHACRCQGVCHVPG